MRFQRLLVIVILIIYFYLLNSTIVMAYDKSYSTEEPTYSLVKGQVIETNSLSPNKNSPSQEQFVKVKVLSDKYKNKIFNVRNTLLTKPWPNIILKKGDKIILYLEIKNNKITNAFVSDYGRSGNLYLLVGLFVLLLIAIGGAKGIKALLALGLTSFSIFAILLPLLLAGHNPIIITIFILTGITLITMPIVGGINLKTWASSLGTIGGVVIAGLLAYYSGEILNLTGFIDGEAQELLFIPGLANLNLKGLLFSGMIIGALGATMDVGISIAATIEEVKKANPQLSSLKLFRAGLNVGRDLIGTMANTLILAYVGSALPMLLLFMANQTSSISLTNSELIATEVVRALSGTIGLIFTVPITSILAAFLLSEKSHK